MPLEHGVSKAALSHNIATERRAGKPEKQAVAIAYSEARRTRQDGAPDTDVFARIDALIAGCDSLSARLHDVCQSARLDSFASRMDSLASRFDRATGTFREADHPRDEDGKFTDGSGSSRKATHEPTKVENGKRVTASGNALPEHIAALKIPPAWTDVTFDSNPDADLLATGRDAKGRVQSIYSKKFSETQAAAKFSRINDLNNNFAKCESQNEEARKSTNARTRDSADCLRLIMQTGIRPGSDDDTLAKTKAYGATTLEGRHVVETDSGVELHFVGKKGVNLKIPVRDKETAEMLRQRAKAAGADGKLFAATNDKALLDHTHSLDGGGFKTKDFRTLLGTRTAMQEVAKAQPPKDQKSYQKAVMEVAKKVSALLGNTPTVALQSYINPAVFAEWRMAV